jgi:hypothetical protein
MRPCARVAGRAVACAGKRRGRVSGRGKARLMPKLRIVWRNLPKRGATRRRRLAALHKEKAAAAVLRPAAVETAIVSSSSTLTRRKAVQGSSSSTLTRRKAVQASSSSTLPAQKQRSGVQLVHFAGRTRSAAAGRALRPGDEMREAKPQTLRRSRISLPGLK